MRRQCSFICNRNPMSSNTNTYSLEKLVLTFTCHMMGTIGQSSTYFFLLSLPQCLMWVMHNYNSYFDIVGGVELILQPFVRWCKGAMFARFDFCIAQSPCIGLHYPTPFGKVPWQSCNTPLWRRAIRLKH